MGEVVQTSERLPHSHWLFYAASIFLKVEAYFYIQLPWFFCLPQKYMTLHKLQHARDTFKIFVESGWHNIYEAVVIFSRQPQRAGFLITLPHCCLI